MSKDGFDALLDGLSDKVVHGELQLTIQALLDVKPVQGGMISRIFDGYSVSDEVSMLMRNDLPNALFNTEPFLNITSIKDPTASDYAIQSAQYRKLQNILMPYLEIMTYKISKALLTTIASDSESPIELNDAVQEGLSSDYYTLEEAVGHDELILLLYSAILGSYTQELTHAQSQKIGLHTSAYGTANLMSNDQLLQMNQFACIAQMIEEYKHNLSIEKIIRCSSTRMNTLGDQFHDEGNIPRALDCYILAHDSEPQELLHVGEKIFNNAIQKLSTISSTTPLFTPYKDLNTLCETLMKAKNEYEGTHDNDAFERMLSTLDAGINAFEKHCETAPNLWHTTIKPIFKALLGATILIALGVSGYGVYYLATHHQERAAFVDSFFNQNKTLKTRLATFKKQFEDVKAIVASEKSTSPPK